MKMTSTLAAFFAALLMASTTAAEQFYKWTDDQGATHYTAEPPPASAGKASEVKVRTKLPSGSKPAQSGTKSVPTSAASGDTGKTAGKQDDKAGTKPAPANDSKGPDEYSEQCKALKANLQAMEEHGRVKETDSAGEVRVLSDEEKQKRMDETQRQIKAFCEK